MVAPRRILLVEDHDDTRELLCELCEMFGHAVVSAGTGGAAIELANSFRPDLALIDLRLPDMTGVDVATALRRTFGSSCRLIALTGFSSDHPTRDGFDTYIVKPIDAKRLQHLISQC
jgi:CheY-like chemotaxis protein